MRAEFSAKSLQLEPFKGKGRRLSLGSLSCDFVDRLSTGAMDSIHEVTRNGAKKLLESIRRHCTTLLGSPGNQVLVITRPDQLFIG
jgi:hypothetical protein